MYYELFTFLEPAFQVQYLVREILHPTVLAERLEFFVLPAIKPEHIFFDYSTKNINMDNLKAVFPMKFTGVPKETSLHLLSQRE